MTNFWYFVKNVFTWIIMEVTINWKWTAEVPNEINLSLLPVSGFVLGKNLRFLLLIQSDDGHKL